MCLLKHLGFILQGHVPPMQRTILEILPLIRPAAHLSSMWNLLLMNLLHYFPSANPLSDDIEDDQDKVNGTNHIPGMTC